MAQKTNLYIYLVKRDKNGVRLLAKFQGMPQLATRLDNLNSLQLSSAIQANLEQIIYDSRMLWEPWIESSDTFDELREKFQIRGYGQIPISPQTEVSNIQTSVISTIGLPKKSTMLRKN